ncbi:putative DNA-directed DNA polymerase [Candidatus Hydrogenisulfobacillus filiaventi]|uniref:Putative DNA-directed DNA polymerase n=1 Tax=Candidatus Hydrogenisulfobacillus filiaventi TaxID=2707344 RepID=A0A6F8ZGD6_9FIRM|nr:putative DNA-directed DNA polymerase [Candidatus Hydrogenisulfobacillus filiaventi]
MAGRGPREWRPWAGWDGPSRPGLEPLVVRRTAAGVEVEFADLGRVSAEERAALAAGLARRLGVPVTVSERRWPSEPPERFRVLMAETGGALGALLAGAWQPAASGEGWDLVLPGEPAASLFRRWGGLERLQAYWPDLPPLQVTVAVPAPAPPPEPVTLPAPAVPPAPGWRAGKGRADGPVLPLAEVLSRNGDNGPVVVTGTVFGVTVRNGREGVRHATFGVGAGNSALKAHLVLRTGEEPPEEGSQVRLKGTVAPDRFSGEPTLEVREGLAVAEPAAPADDGAPEPRVELHCHTKMSAMDSVADLEDLFRKAARLGHPALAITDHAVAQAFPEAAALGRKWGVRPLYGIEVHMVEDQLPVLTGPPAGLPEAPVVVVDLETTGLTPRTHEAIEIGAVKLAGGEVIDRFHALLQPEGPVSRASLQITGLTERELERAEPPAEVWARFFAFARGAVLAAHNAPFDLGFIRAAHRRYQGSSLAVPVLDTLVLARALLPDLKGYGLATLTDHFRVPLTRHHRALADAEATALVLLRLLEGLAAAAGREGDSWRETDLRRPWPMPWAAGRPVPAVLLVRHQHGLEQLYRLISRSHLETFYRVPRVLRSQVQAGRQGPDPDWLVGAPVHGGTGGPVVAGGGSGGVRGPRRRLRLLGGSTTRRPAAVAGGGAPGPRGGGAGAVGGPRRLGGTAGEAGGGGGGRPLCGTGGRHRTGDPGGHRQGGAA